MSEIQTQNYLESAIARFRETQDFKEKTKIYMMLRSAGFMAEADMLAKELTSSERDVMAGYVFRKMKRGNTDYLMDDDSDEVVSRGAQEEWNRMESETRFNNY